MKRAGLITQAIDFIELFYKKLAHARQHMSQIMSRRVTN
jgi:hypothetical protein